MIRAWPLLAIWLALAAIPALALEPQIGPDAALVLKIETALLAFRDQYGRWPKTVGELHNFARKTGRPLDLSQFSNLDIAVTPEQTIIVEYIGSDPSHEQGAFAISVRDISGKRH